MANLNMPAGRDYGTEMAKTLSAQANIMPNLLGQQAQWQPLSTSEQLSNINELMMGTPDMSYETRTFSPAVYRQGGVYSYGGLPKGINGLIQYPSLPDPRTTGGGGGGNWWDNLPLPPGVPSPGQLGISGGAGGGFNFMKRAGIDGGVYPGMNGLGIDKRKGMNVPFSNGNINGYPLPPSALGPLDPFGFIFGGGGDNKPPRRLITPSGYTTQTNFQPGQQGLLSLYENAIAPSMSRTQAAANTYQRGADIGDVAQYGKAAMDAIRMSDPGSAGLVDTATGQAQHELEMGGNLTPAQLRQATQAVRARSTGMLGGTGGAGDLQEAMGIGAYGQQLQQNRRGYAQNVLGQRQSFYGDPFNRVLGRPGAGLGSSANALNQGMGLMGGGAMGLLNPQSSYAGDIYGGNWNALVNGAIANANNRNALIGAGINAFGNLAGSAMGAMI